MVKGIPGRVIFRKIAGRIVPIRISNIADKIATADNRIRTRDIVARLPGGQSVGKLTLQISNKRNHAYLQAVNVEKQFRRRGISKNLFKRTTDFLEKAGVRFLRSSEIQHPAQVKIRSAYGRYKAGGKWKSRTRFYADQFGPYGEETRRITSKEAIEILKNNYRGRQVTATTMLKKKKK